MAPIIQFEHHDNGKNHVTVDNTKVYGTEIIYDRIMGLQESAKTYDTKKLMAHELSP